MKSFTPLPFCKKCDNIRPSIENFCWSCGSRLVLAHRLCEICNITQSVFNKFCTICGVKTILVSEDKAFVTEAICQS